MFFSKETIIQRIDFRIHMMRERGEERNKNLINALLREKRNLLKKE